LGKFFFEHGSFGNCACGGDVNHVIVAAQGMLPVRVSIAGHLQNSKI